MKTENITLIAQLVESMSLAKEELEKALDKKDAERLKEAKSELLKFQKEISEMLK